MEHGRDYVYIVRLSSFILRTCTDLTHSHLRLCGFPPFYDENDATLFSTIKSGEFDYPSPYWDNVSSNGTSSVVMDDIIRGLS